MKAMLLKLLVVPSKYLGATTILIRRVNFCNKHLNMPAEIFIVSFGALINHKNFQGDSSTPSWYKFAIIFTMGTIRGNKAKN